MPPPRGRDKLGPYSICIALACVIACGQRAPEPRAIPPTGPITIAVTGDTRLTRPIDSNDPGFADVRRTISDATLAFTNLDLNLLGPDEASQAKNRPPPRWPFGSPRDAETLAEIGVDFVSLANDHAADYGPEGLASTRRILERAGLLSAGTGADLSRARTPVITSKRVALIAVTTSSSPESRATLTRGEIQGRPGVNPLRYAADITVDPPTFQTLREAAAALGQPNGRAPDLKVGPTDRDRPRSADVGPSFSSGAANGEQLTMFGTTIKKGDRTSVVFTVDERDEREILDQIKTARQKVEVVLVSVHSHEPTNASPAAADFFQRFAHAAIDAGAHAIVGHGPHRLRGIELYHGGVIFYSLGNFLYQTQDGDQSALNPFDAGTDLYALAVGAAASTGSPASAASCSSVIGLMTFESGALTSIGLRPIHLCSLTPGEAGLPRAADLRNAPAILRELEDLSRPYGTIIERDKFDSFGTVKRPG